MSTIRGLYERFRHLIHEGFKFLVIGAIGTIVTFGLANALHDIGKYKAITIATIVATVVTYLGNRYWTFRDRQGQGHTRDTTIFFVLNGIGLLIYYGCIGLTDVGRPRVEQGLVQRGADCRHRPRHAVPVLVLPQVGVDRR